MPLNAHVVHYLNAKLTAAGPAALPYEENLKMAVRDQLLAVVERYPSLSVRDDPFTHNDGRSTHLLRADGTIPIFYQGVKYNIPLKLFLPEGFPKQPPICYVHPTPNMIIKPGHRLVDGSGLVHAPYNDHWSAPRSNLSDLATSLSEAFGQEPPLFAKPAGHPTQPPPPPPPPSGPGGPSPVASPQQQQQHPQQQQQQRYGGGIMGAVGRPPPPPPPVGGPHGGAHHHHQHHQPPPPPPPPQGGQGGGLYPPPPGAAAGGAAGTQYQQQQQHHHQNMYGGQHPQHQQHHQQQPHQHQPPPNGHQYSTPPPSGGAPGAGAGGLSISEATFKSRAIRVLTERLKSELEVLQVQSAGEVERLLALQAELVGRRERIEAGLRDMRSERGQWESRIGSMQAATVALTEWLSENEGRLAGGQGGREGGGGEGSSSHSGGGGGGEEEEGGGSSAADAAFQAEDPLSQQLLNAVARDQALEDTMDCLDEALDKGKIQLDDYLRLTRQLCKDQFMARAEALVVRKVQHGRGVTGGVTMMPSSS